MHYRRALQNSCVISTPARSPDQRIAAALVMSERRRLHIPHGTYYAVQFSSPRQSLFTKPADYAQLESLLASALTRTRTHALAHCWLPHSIHLAVQIESVPLGRFLQGFTSRYARHVHDATAPTGHLFAHRYRAVLLDSSQ